MESASAPFGAPPSTVLMLPDLGRAPAATPPGPDAAPPPAEIARLCVDPERLRLDIELALDNDAVDWVRLRAISFSVRGGAFCRIFACG